MATHTSVSMLIVRNHIQTETETIQPHPHSLTHTHSHLVTHVPDEASAMQDSVLVGSALLGGLDELDHILGTVVVSSGQLQLLP